jgi:hypothetical protein
VKVNQILSFLLAVGILLSSSACSAQNSTATAEATVSNDTAATTAATAVPAAQTAATEAPAATATTASLAFNNKAWNYDTANDVYWQIGVQYSATPETLDYETLGIYVPGAYMTATANGDGTYTAAVNASGTLSGYSAATAPMVFPVNTPGYSAQKAPTAYSYDEVSSYLKAGFIYVAAGMRGKDNGTDASGKVTFSGGAPWGVTDMKAAVRYVRYNKNALPGDTNSIFVFGMSGGGAQSSIIGASGDSPLYTPYLKSIGAAMTDANGNALSDAVNGVMAWCPITSLDYADEAYEWNMGQYSTSGTRADGTFTAALSKDLATAFAEYINKLGIKDENGNILTLEQTTSGIYTAGSYYDYVVKTVETSLNNFLADTTFPYTQTSGGFPGGGMPDGQMPQGGTPPTGQMPDGGTPPAGMMPGGNASATQTSTTYQTAREYIDSLNKDAQWITYDAVSNTAKVTSLAGFVNSQKNPSKSVGAFDDLNRTQAENNVFGNDQSDSLHFDAVMSGLLSANQAEYAKYSDWKASYVQDYASDLTAVDKLGNGIQYRVNMYNPMYYLSSYYEGYQTSTVATHWRIHTGIMQGDTATTVEMNLALALKNNSSVKDVEFTTVWGLAHTMAERSGDSTSNFIAWVQQVAGK